MCFFSTSGFQKNFINKDGKFGAVETLSLQSEICLESAQISPIWDVTEPDLVCFMSEAYCLYIKILYYSLSKPHHTLTMSY